MDDKTLADSGNQITDGLSVGMPEEAIKHLLAAQLGRPAVTTGDICNHLCLQLPQRTELRKQRQPAQGARGKRQGARGYGSLPGGRPGYGAGTTFRPLLSVFGRGRGMADIIQNGVGDSLAGPAFGAASGEVFV